MVYLCLSNNCNAKISVTNFSVPYKLSFRQGLLPLLFFFLTLFLFFLLWNLIQKNCCIILEIYKPELYFSTMNSKLLHSTPTLLCWNRKYDSVVAALMRRGFHSINNWFRIGTKQVAKFIYIHIYNYSRYNSLVCIVS